MRLWRQLRWQIVISHLIVVVVGVSILLLLTQVLTLRRVSTIIQPRLISLTQADGANAIEHAIADLLVVFQTTTLSALVVAALSALIVGLITSLILTRGIITPLQQITQSSKRIADGHYDERVGVPPLEELATVATNFNQMAEALEQIEQQRVALIGNVSHELRTPLTGIEGYLEGLLDGLFPGNPETFAQMSAEVRRLRRLVDDLQALSKVEAGQISLNLTTVDVVPIIERVVAQLQPQALAKQIELVSELPAAAFIFADRDRTAQVLINLVGNAIRYTPEGGRIRVSCVIKQQQIEIAVQDTGVGIPAEALPYIFERFYRVDPSRARSSGGSGIGLTISRHLTWAMAGELTATSAGPGLGSTFYLVLPGPQ